MNKGNTMRVEKRPYESLRKESISGVGVDYKEFEGVVLPSKMGDSRTLVKKRQPWDQEPRLGRRVS